MLFRIQVFSSFKELSPLYQIFMKPIRFGCLVVILLLSSFCEKDPANELPKLPSSYAEIESTIRGKFDGHAVFKWDQYTQLLDKLSQAKFKVLTINEMRNTFDGSKVIVGLRHDVDFNPFKALEMAKIEKVYGIRATYYFLATAEYYGNFSNNKIVRSAGIEDLFKEIYKTGAEIGIHNDLLTLMIVYNLDPFLFNQEELAFYKSLKIRINGTAAHGSPLARTTIPNYQIFSDFAKSESIEYLSKKYPLGKYSLKDYGFKYEAYFIDYGTYFSDSGGKWNDPEGFSGILKKLDSSKPGDRIQILVHADWWGRAPKY
jgi:hypothetical protein